MKSARLALLVLVIALAIWGMTDIRRRARIDPARPDVHKTDLTVYTGAARELLEGRDPYVVTNPRGMYYLYPPLFALLLTPIAGLDPQTQAMIWFAFSCLLAAGCLMETGKIARAASGIVPPWIATCAALAVLMPMLNTLQRGQANIAVLYPLLLGFRLVLAARHGAAAMLGGVLLALPVALKLTPALPAAFVLFQELVAAIRARSGGAPHPAQHSALSAQNSPRFGPVAFGLALGLFLFLVLIPAACVGWSQNLRLLQTWKARVAANENVGVQNAFNNRSYRNQSLENAAYHAGNFVCFNIFGGPDDRIASQRATTQAVMPMDSRRFDVSVMAARGGLLLLLLLTGLSGWVIGDPLHRAAAFGLACLLTLLVSPLSWAHHYIIALPAAVFVPMWLLKLGRRRWAACFAGGLAALSVGHYALLDHVGRVGLLGNGATLLALASFAVIIATAVESRSPSFRK